MSLSEVLFGFRPQQLTLWWSLHVEALQATASEGLAQGPSVAARTGFEPATFRAKGIDSTNAPPRLILVNQKFNIATGETECTRTRNTFTYIRPDS